MAIPAAVVKELREKTGAGMMDCQRALAEANGDMEEAVKILRKKGLSAAAKKAGRTAKDGLVAIAVIEDGRRGGMVELNCETDFVARTEQFQALAKDLAMQVVAARPQWVRIEDIPEDLLQQERESYRLGLLNANKPAHLIDQIIEGKLAKFYEENCLLEQPFIKDENVKIRDLVTASVGALGENIVIRRFARLEVGG
jgi:elongation factor Ts